MNVTISQKLGIGEPTYNVTISTVKVSQSVIIMRNGNKEITRY
mgnify:CR=1 FL=1